MRFLKKNQLPQASRTRASPRVRTVASRPLPAPSQPGSMKRACDQANTQGTGSSASRPALALRCTERAPICMRSMTSIGVTAWKNS